MSEPETLAVRKMRRELALTYERWETSRLLDALAGDQGLFEPLAIEMMLRELEKRQCPDCGEPRRRSIRNCECGHEFAPVIPLEPLPTVEDSLAELRVRMETAIEEIPFHDLQSAETAAYACVATGATAAFMTLLSPSVFVLLAAAFVVWRSLAVVTFLRRYPDYTGSQAARGKVSLGRALAGLGVGLYLLNFVFPVSVMSRILGH